VGVIICVGGIGVRYSLHQGGSPQNGLGDE